MLGIARNSRSGTVKVRNVKTGQIVYRQDMSWHPESPEIREGGEASIRGRDGFYH